MRGLIFIISILLLLPLLDSCGYRGTTVSIDNFDSIIAEVKRDHPEEDFSHLSLDDGEPTFPDEETATEEQLADTLSLPEVPGSLGHMKVIGKYAEVFNDSNYRQYRYAEALGIEPIRSLRDAYHSRRPLIEIKTNQYYTVDRLTHSYPYLVPEAARLLTDIGRSFNDSLRARGVTGCRIIVTSLLRTPQLVRRLRRVNVNSTDSSTHQFGTTFDITYSRFDDVAISKRVPHEQMKQLLATILLEERNRGNCLIKYERKTPCFHITATR
ncbi:MAG: hypothetical protein K2M59_04815 [Muribaculaceae bacterium]|nr:hypothetical protein [Muribaculaceae bacterium]